MHWWTDLRCHLQQRPIQGSLWIPVGLLERGCCKSLSSASPAVGLTFASLRSAASTPQPASSLASRLSPTARIPPPSVASRDALVPVVRVSDRASNHRLTLNLSLQALATLAAPIHTAAAAPTGTKSLGEGHLASALSQLLTRIVAHPPFPLPLLNASTTIPHGRPTFFLR